MSTLVSVKDMQKFFPLKRTFVDGLLGSKAKFIRAVDGVSFDVREGEILALVGESGSGKTTVGKVCTGIYPPTSGSVFLGQTNIAKLQRKELKEFRRFAQMIYQDPSSSLNPRIRVGEAVMEPLRFHHVGTSSERREEVLRMFEKTGLSPAASFLDRYPHELSGGQKQRIVIARALILRPKFLVADEPVAMVDVSVRAQIIKLLLDLKEQFNLTFLLITHDLAIAKHFSDRVAIMYLGKVVEIGPKSSIFNNPQHPYTKALLSAVPVPDPDHLKEKIQISGEIPSPIDPPTGCSFHPRCPFSESKCHLNAQVLKSVEDSHYVACEIMPFQKK